MSPYIRLERRRRNSTPLTITRHSEGEEFARFQKRLALLSSEHISNRSLIGSWYVLSPLPSVRQLILIFKSGNRYIYKPLLIALKSVLQHGLPNALQTSISRSAFYTLPLFAPFCKPQLQKFAYKLLDYVGVPWKIFVGVFLLDLAGSRSKVTYTNHFDGVKTTF